MQVDLNEIDTVDFETYYDKDYSLRKKEMNTSEYIRDERFLAHCVSIKQGLGETKVYWYDEIEPALHDLRIGTRPILAHNTPFDGMILAEHYDIVPPVGTWYFDTVSMGRALHGNSTRASLEALCVFYGLEGKNPNILGKMRGHREIPQEIREEASVYCIGDTDKCNTIFGRMISVYPDDEIQLIDWTVRQFCDPVLYVDQTRARAELERQVLARNAIIAASGIEGDIDQVERELQSANKFAAQLRALGVEPPMKKSARTGLITFAFAQSDEEFMALVMHENEDVRKLMRARLAAKSTIGTTRAERFVKVGDRPLPVGLNYFAAHTGRWGGTNKMNLQNLEKEEKDDDGNTVPLTGELRKSIVAPPGHKVVVADSGQIEARFTAWLAGQTDLLELFASGGDPYCALATDIYKQAVTKADRDMRAVGKAGVLGLGFYMGAARFQATLALGLLGPKMEVSFDFAQNVVNAYRKKNDRIVKLWEKLGVVIREMWQKPRILGQEDNVTVFKAGPEGMRPVLEYDYETMWLPNGLGLHYPDLQCELDQSDRFEYSYRTNKDYTRLHSGIFIENIIQALARVAVGEQLLRINREYRAVMMTHDEIVTIAPDHKADDCLAFMLHEMSQPPAWAPDIPLKAEGGYDQCYSK